MAGRSTPSFLFHLLVFAVLLAVAGRALAGRQIPQSATDFKKDDKKQPSWFIEPDNTGSIFIPGIGRVKLPPQFQRPYPAFPYYGSSGSSYGSSGGSYGSRSGGSYGGSSGSSPGFTGRNYIPGLDDTFIPNPGIEVPIP